MTQPTPTSPGPSRPPAPLNYATPPKNPAAGGISYIGQFAIGCAVFWLVLAGILVLWWVLPIPPGNSPIAYLILLNLALAALTGLSALAWVRLRWAGFVVGVLFGILMAVLIIGGLALLIWSLCSGMKFSSGR